MRSNLLMALISAICLTMALQQAYRAFEVTRAYDSARNQLEALQRTRGAVDLAYRCTKR